MKFCENEKRNAKKTHMADYPGSPCRSCDGPDRGFTRRSPVYVNTIPPASSRVLRAISSSFTANSLSAAAIGLMLYPVLRAHRAHIPGYITAVHMPVRRRPPAAAAIILRIFRGAGRSAGQYGYGSYVPPAPRHHSGRRRGQIFRSRRSNNM